MKKSEFDNYERCAKAWFNRYYRFREKYYADGKTPTESEKMHLDYLLDKYSKFADLANQTEPPNRPH